MSERRPSEDSVSDTGGSGVSRRRFLAGTGAAVAATVMPGFVRDALAVAPAGPDLSAVEHVVLFMQENRSFDHYFGTLRGVRGYGDRTPLRLPSGNTVFHQPGLANLGYTLPFRLDTTATNATCMNAPPMSYDQDKKALNGGKYDGWIRDRDFVSSSAGYLSETGMGTFERADLPFYYALADAFTICDNAYCSTLTQTNPNRLHFFSGSNGLSVGQSATMDNTEPAAGFTWTTYAERLEQAGVSWKVYQQSDNFDDNALAWFANFKNAPAGSPLAAKGMAQVDDLVAAFGADLAAGTLPQVSWIVAPANLSEHANHRPADGEDLTARLLQKLFANPEVWAKTAFILNYDENGGFFDHLPAPLPPSDLVNGLSTVSTAGEILDGAPIGPGFRIPMMIVSPWTTGGWVCSEMFDHTSVLRFLEKRFGVAEPNISAWRRTVCGDLTSAFAFGTANTLVPPLPDTSGYPASAASQCAVWLPPTPPLVQALPAPEPGRRLARALPYSLEASARADAATGRLWLDMVNTGGVGAGLHVTADAYRTDGPWVYTVEPGKTLSDYWTVVTGANTRYDLALHGPNGFLRWYEGDLALETATGHANPAAAARVTADRTALVVDLTNSGTVPCTFTVTPTRGPSRTPVTYQVPAHGSAQYVWALDTDHWWYDLTVSADNGTGFLRRFAGHVENGRPSWSE